MKAIGIVLGGLVGASAAIAGYVAVLPAVFPDMAAATPAAPAAQDTATESALRDLDERLDRLAQTPALDDTLRLKNTLAEARADDLAARLAQIDDRLAKLEAALDRPAPAPVVHSQAPPAPDNGFRGGRGGRGTRGADDAAPAAGNDQAAPAVELSPVEQLARDAAEQARQAEREARRQEQTQRMREMGQRMMQQRLEQFKVDANLTEAQFASMSAIADRYMEQQGEIFSRFGDMRTQDLTEEQRDQMRTDIRAEMESLRGAQEAELATVLDQAQMEQYQQSLAQGPGGFGGGGRGGFGGGGRGGR